MPLNGSTVHRGWKMIGPLAEVLIAGHRKTGMNPYDNITWTFPREHLSHVVHMRSEKLGGRNENAQLEVNF